MCKANQQAETEFQGERLLRYCEAGAGIPKTLYDLVIVSRDGQTKRATFRLDRHHWIPPDEKHPSQLHVWYTAQFSPFERDFELVAIQHVRGSEPPRVTCAAADLESAIPTRLRKDETFTFQFPFTVHGAPNLGVAT